MGTNTIIRQYNYEQMEDGGWKCHHCGFIDSRKHVVQHHCSQIHREEKGRFQKTDKVRTNHIDK